MKLTPGEIYFIREIDVNTEAVTSYVKIGIVRKPKKDENRSSEDRALEHQTGNPRKLFVDSILQTPAVSEIENILHNLHAYEGIYGEWFDFTEDQFIDAKRIAAELVEQAIENEAIFQKAKKFGSQESANVFAQSSPDIRFWHDKLLKSEIRIKECKNIQGEIKNAYALELEAPKSIGEKKEKREELSPFIKVQEKKARLTFDIATFASDRPGLFEEFSKLVTTPPKGIFTISKPKDRQFELSEIDPDLFEYTLTAKSALLTYGAGQISREELHKVSLTLRGFEAKASWDKEIAQSNLKVQCGTHDGIEGVCKWRRKSEEKSEFDQDAFIEAHPRIAEKYFVATDLKPSLIVSKKRSYPHFKRKG
jgi:hypothetical protein